MSLIVAVVLIFILTTMFKMDIITHVFSDIWVKLLHPLGTDRITLTVAENNQPYLSSWLGTFGQWFLWLFLASSALLFYKVLPNIKRYEKVLLSSVYLIFLITLIFSRISDSLVSRRCSVSFRSLRVSCLSTISCSSWRLRVSSSARS